MKNSILFLFALTVNMLFSQDIEVPKSYSNIQNDEKGLFLQGEDERYYASPSKADYSLESLFGSGLLMQSEWLNAL